MHGQTRCSRGATTPCPRSQCCDLACALCRATQTNRPRSTLILGGQGVHDSASQRLLGNTAPSWPEAPSDPRATQVFFNEGWPRLACVRASGMSVGTVSRAHVFPRVIREAPLCGQAWQCELKKTTLPPHVGHGYASSAHGHQCLRPVSNDKSACQTHRLGRCAHAMPGRLTARAPSP